MGLYLFSSQQRVVGLCSEQPRQECLLVVGHGRMPLALGFKRYLE
jgi:hypothetical protein